MKSRQKFKINTVLRTYKKLTYKGHFTFFKKIYSARIRDNWYFLEKISVLYTCVVLYTFKHSIFAFLRPRVNSLSNSSYHYDIFQNEKTRLPTTLSFLKPDYSSINEASKSWEVKDWLLHPVGYVFRFDAKKVENRICRIQSPTQIFLTDRYSTSSNSSSPDCESDTFIDDLRIILSCSILTIMIAQLIKP